MKTSKFSDSQILAILKQAEAGAPFPELCSEHGMSTATFYKWRARFGGMDASMMARLKKCMPKNDSKRTFSKRPLKKVVKPSRRRDLPAELGNWHTTYTRFKRWDEAGVWQRIVDAVSHDSDLELLMIDSTIVRAHQHSAGAPKKQAGNR
jgi:hypothetical protein